MFIKGPLFMMTQTLTLYKIAAIDLWNHWYDKNVKRFPTNLYWTTVIMDSGRNNLDKTSASFMSDSFSPTFTLFTSLTSPKAAGFRLLFFQSWMAFLTFRDDISLGSCQRDGTSALCKYMCVHTHTHMWAQVKNILLREPTWLQAQADWQALCLKAKEIYETETLIYALKKSL